MRFDLMFEINYDLLLLDGYDFLEDLNGFVFVLNICKVFLVFNKDDF